MRGATRAFRQGDMAAARLALNETRTRGPRQLEMLAAIDYLEGRYTDAIDCLASLLERSQVNRIRRYRVKRQLSMAYFQTNQFDRAAALGLSDPLTGLMASFSGTPNAVAWNGPRKAQIPFRQDTTWELPLVEISINGRVLEAKIDTGGDLLSVPWSMARTLGTHPVTTSTGRFAGGSKAKVGWSQAARVDLGGVVISNVPISLNRFDHAVLGTGLLRQFLATLDYPRHQLVLQPKGTPQTCDGIPFLLAGTHLLIVDGTISSVPTKLLVDSGLEADNDACILASDVLLRRAGIPTPKKTRTTGLSGAGTTQMAIGSFPVDEVSLGAIVRHNLTGMTGVMPKQLTRPQTLGFPLGGLVSHNFLRHYRWTLDFERMQMTMEQPHTDS